MRKLITVDGGGGGGPQWAVPIDQDMLDLLEISDPAGLQLELAVHQGTLIVTPVGGKIADPELADAVKMRRLFEESLVRVNERFSSAMRRMQA